ncbi:MAG: V-type ATP synthase subunit I [Chromatiales bacterium]|jgi:V/A-type H+-transporting ATPase subunit I
MSIQALKKLSLVGTGEQKLEVLDRLQALGCMHLTPLGPLQAPPEIMPPEYAEDARRAIRYLVAMPNKRRQVQHYPQFDMEDTVSRVLANQRRLRDVTDHRDVLRERISNLEPWGDFLLPDLDDMGGQRLWFYILPQRDGRNLRSLELPWHMVHKDNRSYWVVVISPQEPPPDLLPVPRVRTGARSLSELRELLEDAELERDEVMAERLTLTRWIHLMSQHMTDTEDRAVRQHAEAQSLDVAGIFAIEGWVPVARLAEVESLGHDQQLALLLRDPRPDETPPTLLDNPENVAAGEDLVAFYQVPSYWAWDPSRVLFFSFALFFSMILSDAGYALVLGALLALGWRRLGRSPSGTRLRNLASVLVVGSLVWGGLVGSYFGVQPPPQSLLARFYLFDIHDFSTMMEISVGIGVLHLVLANAQMVLIQGWSRAGRVAVGWILVMLAGYALWLAGDAHPQLARLSTYLIGASLLGILLLASDRPLDSPAALALRLLDGLTDLTGITKVFGDVLSYLRLFALGLASASLALTFNGLAEQVRSEVEGLGLLLAILILLIGHALNLALAVMSGVVHGLRLNFIEFYNWALSGEGYPFHAFRKKELNQ